MRFTTSNLFTLLICYVQVNFSIAKSIKAVTCINTTMEEFIDTFFSTKKNVYSLNFYNVSIYLSSIWYIVRKKYRIIFFIYKMKHYFLEAISCRSIL